jgi:hypothetical protein
MAVFSLEFQTTALIAATCFLQTTVMKAAVVQPATM